MHLRLLCAALPAVLACSLGVEPARADIYTWVDASGTVNISNLSPPEGAHVTSVMREPPPKLATHADLAREAARQAELQALSDRVRQLEHEIDAARLVPPPQVVYVPPQVVYVPVPAPAPMQYQAEVTPLASGGCNSTWSSCWGWWGSGFYPASVVVVRAPNFHRFPPGHAGHRIPVQRPVRGPHGVRGR